MRKWFEIMNVLLQTATQAAPAGDINATTARPEPAQEWPEGDLPSQDMNRSTLMPGVNVFRLPMNIAQLWSDVEVTHKRQFLPNGQADPLYNQKVKRKMLKFSRSAPLVVVGGPNDGQPVTWNPSSAPRARGGKADNPKTVWVSEIAYLLDVGLQGHLPVAQRVRPATVEATMAEINKYAGKEVRLKTGLSGQCRADAVRRIMVETVGEGGVPVRQAIEDPAGTKGCGARYYTKAFKNPDAGQPEDPAVPQGAKIPDYELTIPCEANVTDQATGVTSPCNSVIRGFESVDEIMPPLGA